MLNFNEDRRQGCFDFKCEPYRDNWKNKKNIYTLYSIKISGGGGWGVGVVVTIIVTARIIDM